MKKLLLLFTSLVLLSACSSNIMKGHDELGADHHFVKEDYSDVMDDLENKKPGVYYAGFPECPYCSDLVPVLEDVLEETDTMATYIKVDDSGFDKIRDRFIDFDESLDESQQSGGGVPFVIVIDEDETIRTHVGTVEGYSPGVEEMSENQLEYLHIKLTQAIEGQ